MQKNLLLIFITLVLYLKPLNITKMKKLFALAFVAGMVTLASCGEKKAEASADSVAVDTAMAAPVDTAAADTAAADTAAAK